MKRTHITALALCCLVASVAWATDKPCIGVYDSRAVAVAYGASEFRKTHKTPSDLARDTAQKALGEAKVARDEKQIKKLKAELLNMRKQRAQLAFGKAPVDDILDLIEGRIPRIVQTAKVEALVSMWNEAELAKHESAELIDVTLLLVAEFEPSKRVLQSVWGLRQEKPLPAKRTNTAVEKGI